AVASTDLTHYGSNYDFEPKGRGPQALEWVRTVNDPAFIRAVEAGDGTSLLKRAESDRSACSAGSVAAINEIAQGRGQRFRVFDYATSADVAGGDTGNFVGYVGGVYA
ncbi:MAG: AmmeMemoRadiSam system protein B, partial [SAR324 cluster bacterium]|nr:AmmeMemoRadiSam system protein B [SAR324 cluster bacterium]